MLSFICLFFSPIIFCVIRERLFKLADFLNSKKVVYLIAEYAIACIVINGMTIFFSTKTNKVSENIVQNLTEHNNLAFNYLLLSILFSFILPFVELLIKKSISKLSFSYSVSFNKLVINDKCKLLILFFTTIFFVVHYLLRMTDNSIWGDEGLVVIAARKNFADMLEFVANYGHSPFHYAFAWILVKLFGENGFIVHISASLPYFILLFISLTSVRKNFGFKVSLLFILLLSLLDCATIYNCEVRMYAWCELFIFLMYWYTYKLYKHPKSLLNLIPITAFSFMAAISHYFALATVGINYLFLVIFYINKNKTITLKIIFSGLIVLLILTPWIFYAKKIHGVFISNYRIPLVKFKDCVNFIFSGNISTVLLITFLVLVIIWFLYELKIISYKKTDNSKTEISFILDNKLSFTVETYWCLSGIAIVFGTIIISELISHILYPIIVLRYLYPSYVIIWILFSVAASKTKFSRLWTFIICIVIFSNCYPNLLNRTKAELDNNRRLETTLNLTQPYMSSKSFIYTDIVHFAWTVEYVYYPHVKKDLFGHKEWWGTEELPVLGDNMQYWLFLGSPISKNILDNLNNQNKKASLIVDRGYIGTGDAWIYKIDAK